jgi:hypothetical protein
MSSIELIRKPRILRSKKSSGFLAPENSHIFTRLDAAEQQLFTAKQEYIESAKNLSCCRQRLEKLLERVRRELDLEG